MIPSPSSKPKILLIPTESWWILGEMGKEIVRNFEPRYGFYYVSEEVLIRRPDLARALIGQADVIHAMNETGVAVVLPHLPAEPPPILTWIHHVTALSPDHQTALAHSDAIVVCTEQWRQKILQYARPETSVTPVLHGVDTGKFRRLPDARKKAGLPADAFVVGFVAARGSDLDRGRKGIDTLMEVLERAARHIRNLHVVIAGIGWEGQEKSLRSLGISARFLGFLPRRAMAGLYSSLDAYLMTSRIEGGPCTVLEAMACETPVVATRVGLVPDVIRDGLNGFSAPMGDAGALCDALLLLHRSPERAREIGRAARSTVLENRQWAQTLAPLQDIYDALIGPARPSAQGIPFDAARLQRATCAADALRYVSRNVRARRISLATGWRLLGPMLEGLGPLDILRGIGLMKGMAFRQPNAPGFSVL